MIEMLARALRGYPAGLMLITRIVINYYCPGNASRSVVGSHREWLKPVRAGQVIGRGGAKRNPCDEHSSTISPARGGRVPPSGCPAAPMGLGVDGGGLVVAGVSLGYASLHPCLCPAAPNGAFPAKMSIHQRLAR